MQKPSPEPVSLPDAAFHARRRQVNRLIAIGLAFCIVMLFSAAIGFAIFIHDMSGRPLVQ